jgi:hypothetical protein
MNSKYKDISICKSKEIIQESITNDFESPATVTLLPILN